MVVPAVPKSKQLRRTIISEVHARAYSGHLGYVRMVYERIVFRRLPQS